MSASKLRSRLSEIEQHMALIEAQMAVLRVERETVARELKAIVYPVLTVPAEILSEIFLQHVSHSGQRLGPLLLTWICRRWREVAVCTPRLWTSFYLESVPLAALWYSRAGTLPLDLNFLTSEPLELSELLPVIIAYSAQWEKLTLDPILLPANLFFSFPCLAKLELLDSTSDGVVTMPTLTDSPRLRELYIDISGLNGLPATFPWAQLTELTIISNLHTCLELLAQTANVGISTSR
ncbi:hypothetical protein FB45DRAFT_297371 [Roridomyces roridus]|uniref:F-box domain-containing protein n=1 Tax=Roridomyces roridus TaxID=1738132 RepID=A0AAD7CC89_9AGAR|nr:hypothetical protein FB45DRAFT_297371 [Roridomyces roridus]